MGEPPIGCHAVEGHWAWKFGPAENRNDEPKVDEHRSAIVTPLPEESRPFEPEVDGHYKRFFGTELSDEGTHREPDSGGHCINPKKITP